MLQFKFFLGAQEDEEWLGGYPYILKEPPNCPCISFLL